MKVYGFPGQGSQLKGMGADLFEKYPDITNQADEILGYSIKELCIYDPDNNLKNTAYTQPALYTVNALMLYEQLEKNGKADFYIGHSLGEYNALLAAEVFNFSTGLKLVKKRGELMGKVSGGGMAAVIGLTCKQIEEILSDNNLNTIQVANINTPNQIVISGPVKDIASVEELFIKAEAMMFIPLKVSGAFHTYHMTNAANEFELFLNDYEFKIPTTPVISNVHAKPYFPDRLDIKKTLKNQINNSVKWVESIEYLLDQDSKIKFIEVGPGKVLQGLFNKIKTNFESTQIIKNKKSERDVENVNYNGNSDKDRSKKTNNNSSDRIDSSIANVKHESNSLHEDICAENLGAESYKKRYNLKYAYCAGGMHHGIASKEMVVSLVKEGMLGFLGTGAMNKSDVIHSIDSIKGNLEPGQTFGINFLSKPFNPAEEMEMVDIILDKGINLIEASAFMHISPALVYYRLQGLSKASDGTIKIKNKIQAKVSRPEVAEFFLSPAPENIVEKLFQEGKINKEQVDCSKVVAMADDLCIESDSGGYTDMSNAFALIPAMILLRDQMVEKYKYNKKIHIGAAGGIGTPEAAAAAFMLGAEFIVTGSINQCTVEAGTSNMVKDLLQQINVQDTDYAPVGDMFEMGVKAQVVKKEVFFPARANKLYDLYKFNNSIDEIDERTKTQLQEKYFKKNFNEIWNETVELFGAESEEIKKANQNSKQKMALIFRWYFDYSTRIALAGEAENKVDFQVHCGSAMGTFNQWVKGTDLEMWQNREVAKIGISLLESTGDYLKKRIEMFFNKDSF